MSSDSTAPLSADHPLTHTTPVLVPILHRTARISVRVSPVMSPSLSDSIIKVEATGVEGPGVDDESYGLDDESYGLDDENLGVDEKSRGLDDEGRGLESDGLGLGEEEVVPEGQQQGALVVRTTLGLGYGSLRRQELALEEDRIY
nr:hypothetical protein [Tanacetum cinerariifolium]